MARSLPPLNGLRAFEAAARHLSFTRAGEELHVTQAAISQQVRQLEERLGVGLLRRVGRGLRLTAAGQEYLPHVREAFDLLARATARVRESGTAGVLTVSVLPSFASKWLVPRLWRFRRDFPAIDVRLSASDSLVDFNVEDVDLAVRYGAGRWAGLESVPLMAEDLFPVCSPALMDGPHPLRTPEDLRWHTLLHETDTHGHWRVWLLAAGVQGVDARRGPSFSHGSLMLQAAIDGQGVALGRSRIAGDDLAAGHLVRPFDMSLPSEFAYYIVYPPGTADRPKVASFCRWLLAEAGAAAQATPAV